MHSMPFLTVPCDCDSSHPCSRVSQDARPVYQNAVVVMPAAKGPKIKIGKPFKKAKKVWLTPISRHFKRIELMLPPAPPFQTDDDDDDDNDCLEPPKPSKKRTLEAKAPTAVVKIAGAASAKGGATVFGNFTEVRGVCPHCNKDVTTDQSRVIGTDAEDYGSESPGSPKSCHHMHILQTPNIIERESRAVQSSDFGLITAEYFHTDCSEAFVLKKFKIPLLAALIDNPFKTGAEG